MNKPAANQFPIHEFIRERWSPRSYKKEKIENNDLLSMFEAARWAPSSINEQPWSFIAATQEEKESFSKMVYCLGGNNPRWAINASALVIILANNNFEKTGAPNRHSFFDAGLATSQFIFEATSRGYHSHIMGGFDIQKTTSEFSIPDSHSVIAFLSVGKIDSPDSLPEDLKARELTDRVRKPLDQILFSEKFGTKSNLI